MNTFELNIQGAIRYKTQAPVSVDDAIQALKGMDVLVKKHVPKVIREITGAKVLGAELRISGVEEGSFILESVVKLVFGSLEAYDQFLAQTNHKMVSTLKSGDTMKSGAVMLVIGALAASAVAWFYWPEPPVIDGSKSGVVNIEGNDNQVLVIGAEAFNTNPEAFKQAINQAVPVSQRKGVARAAAQLVAPARAEGGAGIDVIGNSGESLPILSPQMVNSFPASAATPDESFDQAFSNVRVKVRASDMDSGKKGWAGIIEGLVDNRVRLVFAQEGDAAKVAFMPEFSADVSITYADATKARVVLVIVEKIH